MNIANREEFMFKRLMGAFFVLLALMALPARAQETPTTTPTDEQAVQQQIREQFQTMIQNMVARGINPGDFFQQLRSGADMADLEKQLIDQGIIDQKTIDQMQSNMLFLTARRIQRQLDVADDDWKALWPLVQKVITASAAVNGNRPGIGRFVVSTSPAALDLAHATKALRAAAENPHTSSDEYTHLLRAYRDARSEAQTELDKAQQNLVAVLTIRQEAQLESMGILQ
jgi:hypothetical protein